MTGANAASLEHVRAVLATQRHVIMDRYGAVGVGIGLDPTGSSHVIKVYLPSAAQQPVEPVTIDGIPLAFLVTGPIRPFQGRRRQ